MDHSRRTFLRTAAALAPVGLALPLVARAQAPAACVDPASLPLSQKSKRRALAYAEPSDQPGKACGACAFYTAGAAAGCGTCTLLSGPVAAIAVCSSFAPKP